MATNELLIEARNVTVEYRSAQFKYNTFKEYVFNAIRGKNAYSVHKALKDVSISVGRGESVALVGHNGSGKSTLLRVLAGIIEPPGASVFTRGRIAPMIELGAGFDPELSGRENVYLSCTLMGLSQNEIHERIEEIIHFAELKDFIDIPFKNYSSGMQARLGFACATAVDPDIILADEVLSVGDSNFARKCLMRIEQLRERGTSLILVSHDSAAVKRFCSRAYVFEQGNCVFSGPVGDALTFNEEIMERRYLDSLNAAAQSSKARSHTENQGKQNPPSVSSFEAAALPQVLPKLIALQNETPTQLVDCKAPFKICFQCLISNTHNLEGTVSVGFAFHTAAGVRVFGSNNLELGVNVIKQELESSQGKAHSFIFDFPQGLPELAPGLFRVILGIHDQQVLRTIFCEEIGRLAFRSNRNEQNTDGDILIIKERCSFVARLSEPVALEQN